MQGFFQVVLSMSVFEQRLSFRMIYLKIKDHEMIVKCGGDLEVFQALESAWWSLGVGSGGKGSEKFWRANK